MKRWLRTDIRALKQEAKIVGHYLYEQGVTSRSLYVCAGGQTGWRFFLNTDIKICKKRKINIYQYKTGTGRIFGLKCKDREPCGKKFEEQGLDRP